MTYFAAFREGQFLRKESRSRIFQENPEAIPGISQTPMAWPNSGPFHIYFELGQKRVVSATRRVGGRHGK